MTPTTDAGRLRTIYEIAWRWAQHEDHHDDITPEQVDAEALAKVRALLSEGSDDKVIVAMHVLAATLASDESCGEYTGPSAFLHCARRIREALGDQGEPAKVRDESQPPPGWTVGAIAVFRDLTAVTTCEDAWRIYDDEHGYAPQGAPPLPDGWTVDRHDEPGAYWAAWRERDAGNIEWHDLGALFIDVNVAEGTNGDEFLAVMQHLAALRSKP
jgi:hypothetical protein